MHPTENKYPLKRERERERERDKWAIKGRKKERRNEGDVGFDAYVVTKL